MVINFQENSFGNASFCLLLVCFTLPDFSLPIRRSTWSLISQHPTLFLHSLAADLPPSLAALLTPDPTPGLSHHRLTTKKLLLQDDFLPMSMSVLEQSALFRLL